MHVRDVRVGGSQRGLESCPQPAIPCTASVPVCPTQDEGDLVAFRWGSGLSEHGQGERTAGPYGSAIYADAAELPTRRSSFSERRPSRPHQRQRTAPQWHGVWRRVGHSRTAFLEDFARWVVQTPVRGKFSVLPHPAGLGPITSGWEGYSRHELAAWLAIVRDRLMPRFDVTPEVLTHTRALDLASGTMLAQSEHDWMGRQDEDVLAHYMARSIALLDEVGLRPGGLTQPCYFRGDELVYAHAIQRAFREHGRSGVIYYFLHVRGRAAHVRPTVTLCDRARGSCVVSIPSATGDEFWPSQPAEARRRGLSQPATVDAMADRLIDARGERGRLVDLLRTESDLILLTHWQSLYSDGSGLGLRALAEVVDRIGGLLGDRVLWLRADDLARYVATAASVEHWLEVGDRQLEVHLDSPFACPGLTLDVEIAGSADVVRSVSLDSDDEASVRPLAGPLAALAPGREGWILHEGRLRLMVDVGPGAQRVVIGF